MSTRQKVAGSERSFSRVQQRPAMQAGRQRSGRQRSAKPLFCPRYGDPTETERAKVEAGEELKVIAAHLSKDSRTLHDPAKAAGDAVRIGINRFPRDLVGRGRTVASPLRVRRGFAKHLERYLLVAEQPLRGPRSQKGERRSDRLPALRPAPRNALGREPVTGFPTRLLLSPHRR
jgi:hypothetical protein